MRAIIQGRVHEWSFASGKTYNDPFNNIELDVVFTDSEGKEQLVPAFWAGGNVWRVRFSSPKAGTFNFKTVCSDKSNADLHDQADEFTVTPYVGDNPLYLHGPVVLSDDRRTFRHTDGTPFLWLGDTWWMGLTNRMSWPSDFQKLALDRLEKGFNVIQIVAGLYPDMPPFYPGGANEAGFPWEPDYSRINPAYFDYADRRIAYLAEVGLVPCIFGCWGYFAKFMGVEKLKEHWRYIMARYGAYPVIWSLAGEAILPYYEDPLWGKWDQYTPQAREDWTEITSYARSIEPFGRVMSIHPPNFGDIKLGAHNMVEDRNLIDFDMLQTAHGSMNYGWHSVGNLRYARSLEPAMPVLQSEGFYEGILEQGREETQRWFFWSSILSGAAGHTYGANGIWQLNTKEKPFRGNPIGAHWGDTPWDVAANLPGSKQIGIGKKLLEEYRWWEFEPHQEWIESAPKNPMLTDEQSDTMRPYAAGIPGRVRMIYTVLHDMYAPLTAVLGIEPDVTYKGYYFNPSDGTRTDIGVVSADVNGRWTPPAPPSNRDWVIVLYSDK